MSPRWRSGTRWRAGGRVDPPQDRLHPCDQLSHAERLGEVVVGADRQADDEVGLVVAGGEHQHRYVAVALDAPAHLQAVEAGEHQVEHAPGRGATSAARSTPEGPSRATVDLEALAAQPGRHRVGDRRLVLDDQDASSHAGNPTDCVPVRAPPGRPIAGA